MRSWLLLVLLATPAFAGPVEQRCADLGTGCACSEPLDFAGTTEPTFDPPDSEGPGAKECGNQGRAIVAVRSHPMVTGSSVGLPSAGHVLAAQLHDNGQIEDVRRDFPNGTYCLRHYVRYSQGLPVPQNAEQDIKGPRNVKPDGGPHPGVESQWDTNALKIQPQFHSSAFGTSSGLKLSRSGPDVSLNDCKASWCRIELCYDHNAYGQNKLNWRARVVQISTGKTNEFGPELSPRSSPTVHSGDANHLAKWWTDVDDDGQTQWFSRVMVAIVPVNPVFWIGPALELEPASIDSDGDGLPDDGDNCILVPNADQLDSDGDGCGNRCDGDFDQSGLVDAVDLSAIIQTGFGSTQGRFDVQVPHDTTTGGLVNVVDLSYAVNVLYGRAPGPSAKGGAADCSAK